MNRFQLNSSNVVQDLIDGEVLAIRSDTGTYYSMIGPAASAWLAVISGQPVAVAAEQVAHHHGAVVDDVAAALHTFAGTLAEETLVIPSAAGEADGNTTGAAELQLPAETAGAAWSVPVFEKYTDMQDLLLFDPIHEVQSAGWPSAAVS